MIIVFVAQTHNLRRNAGILIVAVVGTRHAILIEIGSRAVETLTVTARAVRIEALALCPANKGRKACLAVRVACALERRGKLTRAILVANTNLVRGGVLATFVGRQTTLANVFALVLALARVLVLGLTDKQW
jgi:hypothetical protein